MTEKQLKILHTALKLFANEGYSGTSTARVAKEAGVSEGLIFRHFKNKAGLLDAIMGIMKEKVKLAFADIVLTTDPKEVIRKTLELPLQVEEKDYELWRLTYALKWQTDRYSGDSQDAIKPVLRNAFEQLGYNDPDAEVEIILMILDGIVTSFLLHPPKNKEDIIKHLLKKYDL